MTSLRYNIRRWWQPPRKLSEREDERSVTFLELFYDLVYVVIIAQLAHALAENVTAIGVLGFALLFVIVWLAWINGTLYHDLHGNNDVRTRVFTFIQMFTVAGMAVFAHNALGDGAVGFALAFVAYQVTLTYLWWRTGVHDPDHRPLSQPYAVAYLIATLIFFSSVYVDPPWRQGLWAVAVLFTLALPLILFSRSSDDPSIQDQIDLSLSYRPSTIERFGLFTIIVLGEVMVGVVSGVAGHHELTWLVGVSAALGMLTAIGLWWVYFDYISQRHPLDGRSSALRWLNLHLPMTVGIAASGAAILNVVEHAGEPLATEVRWLLVGSVALALFCIAALMRNIQFPEALAGLYRAGGAITLGSGIVILLLGLTGLPAIPLLLILDLLLLAPIFYGLKVWIQMGGEELEIAAANVSEH